MGEYFTKYVMKPGKPDTDYTTYIFDDKVPPKLEWYADPATETIKYNVVLPKPQPVKPTVIKPTIAQYADWSNVYSYPPLSKKDKKELDAILIKTNKKVKTKSSKPKPEPKPKKRKKPVDKAKSDKLTNARLLKTYGITLAEYNDMLEKQGGVCAICKKPPGRKRLHVDHDHALKKLIETGVAPELTKNKAFAEYGPLSVCVFASSKKKALAEAYDQIKKHSVRGLLCWPCNRGLRVWWDKAEVLKAAALYLEKYQRRFKEIIKNG